MVGSGLGAIEDGFGFIGGHDLAFVTIVGTNVP